MGCLSCHLPGRSLSPQPFPQPTCLSPPFFRVGFSLPCCLFSLPPPPVGPFRRQQMGMNVTLAISLPVLCPGPAERSSWSLSRWELTGGQNVGVGCRGTLILLGLCHPLSPFGFNMKGWILLSACLTCVHSPTPSLHTSWIPVSINGFPSLTGTNPEFLSPVG